MCSNCYHNKWLKQAVEMAEFAYKHSTFYNNLYSDNNVPFNKLPIVNKSMLQSENKSIITKENNAIKLMTSGSTGIPLNVFWDNNEYTISNFYTWQLRKKWYNVFPTDKCVKFHSSTTSHSYFDNKIIISDDGLRLSLSRSCITSDVLLEYTKLIEEYDPKWIIGQASIIMPLVEFSLKHNIVFKNLQYIELNGEFVEDGVILFLKKNLGISVSNLYGSVEFNGIALTCPKGNMHIIEKNVFVESDAHNNILVTGLVNRMMPLIRYNIGDLGMVFCGDNCECGEGNVYLQLYRGRKNELVAISSGFAIDVSIFNVVIDKIKKMS